jgi:hypothetical protein
MTNEASNAPQRVEQVPSVENGVSAIASANAPFIFFDNVAVYGDYNGIVHMTLQAGRFVVGDGAFRSDQVMVAHLRMNMVAFKSLKEAVEKIERMIRLFPEDAKH